MKNLEQLQAEITEDVNASQTLKEWEAVTEVTHVGIENPSTEEFNNRREQAHKNGKPFKFSTVSGRTYFSTYPDYAEAVFQSVADEDWNTTVATSEALTTDAKTVSAEQYEFALDMLTEAQGQLAKIGVELPTEKALNTQQAVREYAKTLLENQQEAQELNPQGHAQMVSKELTRLQVREAAQMELELLKSGADLTAFANAMTLEQGLEEEFPEQEWRVKNMFRVGHVTTVAAVRKAGKSSFAINRLKSFADGVKLFGYYETKPAEGNICYMNYELSDAEMYAWFKSLDIKNKHKIIPVNARGANLYIRNPQVAEAMIEFLNTNNVEILEIDPLSAALGSGTTSDDAVAADWIGALQRIIRHTKVKDVIISTHMGTSALESDASKGKKRTIGSYRWESFTDNNMIFERVDRNTSQISSEGRDIFLDPIRVEFDPETRLMSYKGEAIEEKEYQKAQLRWEFAQNLITAETDEDGWIAIGSIIKDMVGDNKTKKAQLKEAHEAWVDLGNFERRTGRSRAIMLRFTELGSSLFEKYREPSSMQGVYDQMVSDNRMLEEQRQNRGL